MQRNPSLAETDIPADPLKNFNTVRNKLSVYEATEAGPSVERIVAAVIANGERLDTIDYATIEESFVREIGISWDDTDGSTIDIKVNEVHRDCEIGTASRLCVFVRGVMERGTIKRLRKTRVQQIIVNAIRGGDIELAKLKPGVKSEVESLLAEEK